MSAQDVTTANIKDILHSRWGWFVFLGIVFLLGGLGAFLAPFVATMVVTLVVAACLVVVGAVQVVQAWTMQSWSGFLWQLLIGLVLLIGGGAIYFNPVASAFMLTWFMAAMFLAKGIFQIILGFRIRPYSAWRWVVAAGVMALLVGLMILMNYPFSGVYAIGLLAGISLMFTGWSYIALAIAAKNLD